MMNRFVLGLLGALALGAASTAEAAPADLPLATAIFHGGDDAAPVMNVQYYSRLHPRFGVRRPFGRRYFHRRRFYHPRPFIRRGPINPVGPGGFGRGPLPFRRY